MRGYWIGVFLMVLVSLPTIASDKRSTIEFIQVQNGLHDEARFYYQKNWLSFRQRAKEQGYIDRYLLAETEATADTPYHFVLVTTYATPEQYAAREDNFAIVMAETDGIQLLNDKTPTEFRKTLFFNEGAVSTNSGSQ